MQINKPKFVTVDMMVYVSILIALLPFIALRATDVGSDSYAYSKYFEFVKYGAIFDGAERIEIGFYWLTKFVSNFTDSHSVYFGVIFLLQFIGITSAYKKKSELFKPYLLIALVWLAFPLFYSITLNVIRQGIAFIFVVYALDAKLQHKRYVPYLLLMLGVTIHYATLLYVVSFLILEFGITAKRMLYFWIFSVISAAFNLTQEFVIWGVSILVGDNTYYSTYLEATVNSEYQLGFKIHLVLFSAIPIVYYYVAQEFVSHDAANKFIFKLYLSLNICYLFTMNMPYSDRFALASWLLMPFMINLRFLQTMKLNREFLVCVLALAPLVFTSFT